MQPTPETDLKNPQDTTDVGTENIGETKENKVEAKQITATDVSKPLVESKDEVSEETECPDEFKCAVCHNVMTDPIIITAGNKDDVQNNSSQIYDNHCTINLKTDPLTNLPIINRTPVPLLFKLNENILDWRIKNRKEEFVLLPKKEFISSRTKQRLQRPVYILADGTSCNERELTKEDKKMQNVLLNKIMRVEKDQNYLADITLLKNEDGEFFSNPVVALHGNGNTVEEKSLSGSKSVQNKVIIKIIKFAKKEPAPSEEAIIDIVDKVDQLREPLLPARPAGQPEVDVKADVREARQERGAEGEVLIRPEEEHLNRNPGDQNVRQRSCVNPLTIFLFVATIFGGIAGLASALSRDPDPTPSPSPDLPTYSPILTNGGTSGGVVLQNPNNWDVPINSIQIVTNGAVSTTDFHSNWMPQDVQVQTTPNSDQLTYTTTITPTTTPIRLPAAGGKGNIQLLAQTVVGPLKVLMDPQLVAIDIGSGLQPLTILGKSDATDPTPNFRSIAHIPNTENRAIKPIPDADTFDLTKVPTKANTIGIEVGFDAEGNLVNDPTLTTVVPFVSSLKKQFPKYLESQVQFRASPDVCQQVLNNATHSENLANNIAAAVVQTHGDAVQIGCMTTAENVDQMTQLVQNIKAKAPQDTQVKVTAPAAIKDIQAIPEKQFCEMASHVDEFTVSTYTPFRRVVDYTQPVRHDPRSPNQDSLVNTLSAYNHNCTQSKQIGVVMSTNCQAAGVATFNDTFGLWQPVETTVLGTFTYGCVAGKGIPFRSCIDYVPPTDLVCLPAAQNPVGQISQQGVCTSASNSVVMLCQDPTSVNATMKAAFDTVGDKLNSVTIDNVVRDLAVTDSRSLTSEISNFKRSNSTVHSQQTNSTPVFNTQSESTLANHSFTNLFNSALEKIYHYFPENLRGEMYNAAKQGALCGFLTALVDKGLSTYLSSQTNPVTQKEYTKEEIFWLGQFVKTIAVFFVTLNPVAAFMLPVGGGLLRMKFDFETSNKYANYSSMLWSFLSLNPFVLAAGIAGGAVGSFIGNNIASGGRKVLELGNSAYETTSQAAKSCANKTYQVAGCVKQGFFALKDRATGMANRFNPFAQKAVTDTTPIPALSV